MKISIKRFVKKKKKETDSIKTFCKMTPLQPNLYPVSRFNVAGYVIKSFKKEDGFVSF